MTLGQTWSIWMCDDIKINARKANYQWFLPFLTHACTHVPDTNHVQLSKLNNWAFHTQVRTDRHQYWIYCFTGLAIDLASESFISLSIIVGIGWNHFMNELKFLAMLWIAELIMYVYVLMFVCCKYIVCLYRAQLKNSLLMLFPWLNNLKKKKHAWAHTHIHTRACIHIEQSLCKRASWQCLIASVL